MASVKINTDVAVSSARNIKRYNTQIRDNFPTVQTAITQLDNCWDGSAASNAIRKFYEINAKFADARYNVIDNYVNFLNQQVGAGYEKTEASNVSLASKFR